MVNIDNLLQSIHKYIEKHNEEDNEYLIHKLDSFINELNLDNDITHNILTEFMDMNNFYYISTSQLFIHYNNDKFIPISEDNLIHYILSFLTSNRDKYNLNTELKYFYKSKIMKHIKKNSIQNVIPETNTIQQMISFFYPNFFEDKNFSKYFFIIIGDIIMKKNIYTIFIPYFMKPFLQKISNCINMFFQNINLLQWFKFKYTNHDKELCRFIYIKELNLDFFNLSNDFFITMICCCIHYSNRYSSSEDYLMNHLTNDIKKEIQWIEKTSKDDLIQDFIKEFIIHKEGSNIHEKDMLFLWKSFIQKNKKINIFENKQSLYENLSKYISSYNNHYINITSMYIPCVIDIQDFWKKHIYYDETEYNFEINELYILFNQNYKSKINESTFKDLITFYYQGNEIIDNKFINHIGCTLWNKKKELECFFKDIDNKQNKDELYLKYCNDNKKKKKISKQYFFNYIKNN